MGKVEQGLESLIGLVSRAYPASLGLSEAATALGVSDRTVRRYVEKAGSQGLGLAIRGRTILVTDRIPSRPPEADDGLHLDDEELAVCLAIEELAHSTGGWPCREDLVRRVAERLRTEEYRVEAAIDGLIANGLAEVVNRSVRPRRIPTAAYALTADEISRLLDLIRTEREAGNSGKALAGAERNLIRYAMRTGDTSALGQYASRRWVRYFQGRPRGQRSEFERHAEFIDECIARRHRLLAVYRPRRGGMEEQVVCPLGTVYYWAQDDWYLAVPGYREGVNLLRGSRISSLRETWLTFDYPEDFDLVERFREPWGVEMSGVLHDVEVRFFDDFRVIDKVRGHVAYRPSATLTTLDDGSVVLRDRVRGLTEIASWIRQFGASAVVLKPEALRERMEETASRLHEKYSDDSAPERLFGELSRLPGGPLRDRLHALSEPEAMACPSAPMLWRAPEVGRPPDFVVVDKLRAIADALMEAGDPGLSEAHIAHRFGILPDHMVHYRAALESLRVGLEPDPDEWDQDDGDYGFDDPHTMSDGYRSERVWRIYRHDARRLIPIVFTPNEAEALLDVIGRSTGGDAKLASACVKLRRCLLGADGEVAATAEPGMSRLPRWRCVKGLPALYNDVETEAKVSLLEECAQDSRLVSFMYDRDGRRRVVAPLALVYFRERGEWYLAARDWLQGGKLSPRNNTYRVDTMRNVEAIAGSKFAYPEDFRTADLFRDAWGMATGRPAENVIVHFENDFNVPDKVLKVAKHREHARVDRLSDGSILYSDLVSGVDEFRAWIRGFGSSAQILAPAWLRAKHKEAVDRLMRLYFGG
jgi:predicted DNA-binding transcriptional regulator YafY